MCLGVGEVWEDQREGEGMYMFGEKEGGTQDTPTGALSGFSRPWHELLSFRLFSL